MNSPTRHLVRRHGVAWVVACGVAIAAAALPTGVRAEATRLRGVDTSHHNGEVDWRKVADSRIAFAFIKATDGLDYLDPAFADHFKAAGAAGLVRGAYHFYETNDGGLAQAEWFIRNVELKPGDLPPVVDIERIKGPVPKDLHAQFDRFLDRLEQHYGRRPIIYTGPKFWEHAMREHLPGNRLWIAQYGVPEPTVPPQWKSWSFWQYTERLKLPGAPTPLDGSWFNGGAEALRSLVIPAR